MTDREKDDAKAYILEHAEDVFEKWMGKAQKRINGKNSYICPFCGNGGGESGTGIAWNPKAKSGNEWHCFVCERSGDIFDFWMEKNNIPRRDFPKAIEQIAGFMGYSFLSGTGKPNYSPAEIAAQRAEIEEKSRMKEKELQEKREKETETIKKELDAARRKLIDNPDGPARKYLEKRGFKYFDEIFSDKYGLGYLDNWRGRGARLIIKTGENSYFCRDIRDEIPESQKEYEKLSPGGKHFFNLSAIWESDSPVIVVEGEIDALSLISLNNGDVGVLERVEAVALGSISMINKFAEICAENPPKNTLIISLDNDKNQRGQKAEGELLNLLHDAKIPAIGANIAGKCKDVNEALQGPNGDTNLLHRVATAKSRARMFSFSPIKKESTIQPEGTDVAGPGELVDDAGTVEKLPDDYVLSAEEIEAQEISEKERQAAAEYLKKSDKHFSDRFRHPEKLRIEKIPTGFYDFDEITGGGLRAGVCVIGAITSLGKSTFCLQLAGQIAEQGRDVLYFSLEMSRDELMAKTYSRMTYQKAGKAEYLALTTQEITDADERERLSDEQERLLFSVFDDYDKIAGNLYTIERGDCERFTISTVCDAVQDHIHYTGKKPVVILDYLQYLEPDAETISPRQNIDISMKKLKALSLSENLLIIVISSFNRDNYFSPVDLGSFKESGGIEYSSDLLLGLQYHGMDYEENEAQGDRYSRIWGLRKKKQETAAAGGWVDMDLKILKNRGGVLGSSDFSFKPKYSVFKNDFGEISKQMDADRINSLTAGENFAGSGYKDKSIFDTGD